MIFSWERALRPETESDTALTYLGDIVGAQAVADGSAESLSGVRAINDKTLEVTIDAPKPYFLVQTDLSHCLYRRSQQCHRT